MNDVQLFISKNPSIVNIPESLETNSSQWLYEQTREICIQLGFVVVRLMDICKCVEMRASEWQFLCAAHTPPHNCSALNYCIHTLDYVTNLLTSPTEFPDIVHIPEEAVKSKFSNIYRRLYRIFAHTYFEHPELFNDVENAYHHLYDRFLSLSQSYGLLAKSSLIIPSIQ